MPLLVSVPLTLFGFFLALFGIKRPEKAREIEAFINKLGKIRFPPRQGDILYKLTWRIFIVLEIATMILIYVFMFFDESQDGSLRSMSFFIGLFKGLGIQNITLARLLSIPLMLVMMVFALVGPILVPMIFIRFLNWFIKLLKSISHNHALEALGILLALPGVIEGLILIVNKLY